MKRIDTGNSSFEKLITENNLYVDKTKYLYSLLTDGGTYYFLSRPRRFGKSLFLDTLEQVFKGRRQLFKDLYIDSTDYDWKEYPVIHIDFSEIDCERPSELKAQIKETVFSIAEEYGIEINEKLPYNRALKALIEGLGKKEKVVVLIDEYDSPLSNNINSNKIEEIMVVLRGFYSIFKSQSKNIRMCFITGVTKYAKLSVFSSMNNPDEISLDKPYAAAFGFTQNEVETYFDEYIEKGRKALGLTRKEYLKKLKDKYDGYRFSPYSDEAVYNPVSVCRFFSKGGVNFDNYWVETGCTKLLMDIAKKVNYNIDSSLDEPICREDITNFDIVDMAKKYVTLPQYKSLLFQSGHLTIKRTEDEGHTLFLDYPNGEVKSAFASIILNSYLGDESINLNPTRLRNAFEERETEKAVTILKSYYANMSGLVTSKSVEADYQLMLHCMLIAVDADINVEVVTNKGRIDGVLKTKDTIYVIELKRDESADAALKQIKDKDYVERYLAWRLDSPEHQIRLLGMNFSSKERNITEWKEEILE